MRQDKLSKQNVILYLCGIIPAVWLGLLIAPCLKDGLPGLVQQFGSVMQNPFQIQLCEDSVKTVLTLLLMYGIAIGVYSKMICQGRRNDIIEELKKLENPDEIKENSTSGTQCHRTKSRDILGAEYDLKGRAVANYLRINELITPLKRRIDDAEFPIVAAVQLSFLTEQEQQMVDDVLSENEYKVNEGKAVLLREYTGKLTPERTEQILSGEFNRKPKKSTATAFKVKPAIYKKYFTASISQKEFDSIVDEALALYFAQKGQESEQEAG